MVYYMLSAAILWLSVSITLLATCWYFGSTLNTLFPNWWQRNVADYDPYYEQMAQIHQCGKTDGNAIIFSQPATGNTELPELPRKMPSRIG